MSVERKAPAITILRILQIGHSTLGGHTLCSGERVLLPFPAANRDPAEFNEPNEFHIDRERNRHLAFGVGIHRCVGSNLARMELRVAIAEWLAVFPEFSVVESAPLDWTGGQVRGPRSVPVRLGPPQTSPRLGSSPPSSSRLPSAWPVGSRCGP